MSKTVDVDLRIRAKNLSKSTLAEISADVDRLTKAQEAQAKSSDLAARSMKDLVAEQSYLAAASRELARRSNLAEQFSKERVEIEKTSAKIKELTALRKRAADAPVAKGAAGQNMKGLDTEITKSEAALKRLAVANDKTGNALRSLGVDTDNVETELAQLSAAATKSGTAYAGAVDDVKRYGVAVEQNNAIIAEAVRRTNEETAARNKLTTANRNAASATGQRTGQLAALKADIEARSALARAAEVSAEAQRRAGNEAAEAATKQQRATKAIRDSVQAYDARKQRLNEAVAAFSTLGAAQEREAALNARLLASQIASDQRRARLVKLLGEERVQRMMGINAINATTAATDKNAAATGRAAKQQQLFDDTGRKSLSVYQRIRGQVLGLAAAYIGVYQVIGTFQKALDAVNRSQSLNIGLKVVNSGDAKLAAADYKFLREEADRLGLVFDDIAPKFVGMAIAGKAVGLTGKQIRDAFTNVATAVSAGSLSIGDSEGVFRAVVQVMSKARVQAEELRGQLGDRLPGAVAEFAKANNIALTDLDEHLKKGKGNVDQFLKFLESYASMYAPTLDEATTRLQANINRAKNAYNDWLRQLLSSTNQTALKGAFKALEEFFKGKDGEKFAENLGKAFRTVVEIFMWMTENIEIVSRVLKAFLLIQVTKFAIDAANGLKGMVTWLTATGNAAAVATTKTTGFAGAAGKLRAALGPIALLLFGITEALNMQSNALDRATAKTEEYIDRLLKLQHAEGFDDLSEGIENSRKAVGDLTGEIDELVALRDKAFNGGPIDFLTGQASLTKKLGADGLTREGTNKRINELYARQKVEIEGIEDAEKKLTEESIKRRDEEAKAAKEAAAKPISVEVEAKEKKTKKGIDPEEIARRQADAARAAADKILEIQDDIEQAKIDKSAKTDEQIETNYNATMERIKLKIEETKLDIDKLMQNSAKAGVDNSAEFTRMDGLLQNLEAQLQNRAQYDMASAKVELREEAINTLIDERAAKLDLINAQVEAGAMSSAEAYAQTAIAQEEYNVKVTTMINEFLLFAETIRTTMPALYVTMGLDQTIAKLNVVKAQAVTLSNTELFKKKFGGEIAAGFSNAFTVFAQGVAGAIQGANSLSDAFKSAGDAFLNFAADFLTQIAAMIVQQVILNALQGSTGGTFSQIFGQAMGKTGHTGGVVKANGIGSGNAVRPIAASHFMGAQRFHEGGLPGLKTGEVTAILKKREEVVTADDPRNVLNGGMAAGGGGGGGTTIINSIDSASVVAQGWKGSRNVVLNDVKANQAQWRANLGIKN